MRDLSDVELLPSDFPALRELCRQDRDFPPDFKGWHQLLMAAEHEARSRSLYPTPLLLNVADFEHWCTRLKVMPCLDALRAYVIIRRRETD